jgi:hypothetical protein
MPFPRPRRRKRIPAIHDDQLVSVLDNIGLLKPLERGELGCVFCGLPVTLQNLAGLVLRDSKVRAFCNNAECLLRAQERHDGEAPRETREEVNG